MSSPKNRIRESFALIGRARKAGIDAPRRHLVNVTVFIILALILIVYVGDQSSADRAAVESYLAKKYSL